MIFGSGFFTMGKNYLLKFSNESMVTPCPFSFNKTRRESQNFLDGQSFPRSSEQMHSNQGNSKLMEKTSKAQTDPFWTFLTCLARFVRWMPLMCSDPVAGKKISNSLNDNFVQKSLPLSCNLSFELSLHIRDFWRCIFNLYRVSQEFVPLILCTITFDQNFIFT